MSTGSTIIDLADAVLELLNDNAAALLPPDGFEAERKILPTLDVAQIPDGDDGLAINVVPGGFSTELLARNSSRINEWIVDVAVTRRVKPDEVESVVPALLKLVEDIAAKLIDERKVGDCMLLGLANEPIYGAQMLREKHLFLSVLRLTFRKGKS